MPRGRALIGVSLVILLSIAARSHPDRVEAAPEEGWIVRELLARARVFPEVGPGVSAIKRDSRGRYYILSAPKDLIAVYGPAGERVGRIPNTNSRDATLIYAADMDLDPDGRLFVADRGANAVKLFDPAGSRVATIPVVAPTSLVALSGGECAVVSLRSDHLVRIFNVHGELVRSFGDLPEAGTIEQNPLSSRGRVSGDPAGHIYFAFSYLPEPTFRKYDRYGYRAFEWSLRSPEVASEGQAERHEFITLERRRGAPRENSGVNALGVDPDTEEIWAAVGDELLEFDKDGIRRAAYRVSTREGARIAPDAILVEPDRILLAADPLGIFDFARPEKPHPERRPD
jgi:hypothetical protein